MSRLSLTTNIANPDELYDWLIALHDGLDDQQSAVANSKLILLLANHIGDEAVIREAIGYARTAACQTDCAISMNTDVV